MRKQRLILLIVFLIAALIFSIVSVQSAGFTYNVQQVEATLVSQTPDPVQPGEIVKVKFKIENSGSQTSEDAVVQIRPKYPFTSYGGITEKNIGKLRAASTGADAPVVEFVLLVDREAIEGDQGIDLVVLLGENGGRSYTNDEFTISIKTQDSILDITQITSQPSQVAPGDTAKIDIMIKNSADSMLKDIKFSLDFDDDTIPLAPYQSSSERRLQQLRSGYQNSVSFQMIADPEATPGLYKVPLTITYYDEDGQLYTISDLLAVSIGETPKIRAYVKKSTVLQNNKAGTVTLEIANSGTTDVKFLELTLLPSDDYQLVSTTNYFYIGDVDSDDTESEDIELFINRGVDVLNMPIQLKYNDANNNPLQQQFDLEMQLYSSYKLKKFGILPPSQAGTYLVLLILIVGGIYLYRKKKKDPQGYAELMEKNKNRIRKIISKIPFLRHRKKK